MFDDLIISNRRSFVNRKKENSLDFYPKKTTSRHGERGNEKWMKSPVSRIKDDPNLLAVELTAPAVLQIARSDRQPQYEKESMECRISKSKKHLIICQACRVF